MTIEELQLEKFLNIESLKTRVTELHPQIRNAVQANRERSREYARKGVLPNFTDSDYVLVAREDFYPGEKLALRWRGPCLIVKPKINFVFNVEDLRTGVKEEIHGSRLKFYHDASLDAEAVMSRVLPSETGMVVARPMRLEEHDDGLYVVVHWKGLPHSEDTLEPLGKVYEDLPRMLERLFTRKNTPTHLAEKARILLAL